MIRRGDSDVFLDFNLCFRGTVVGVAGKLKERKWHVSRVFLSMIFIWMLILKVLVELIFR